MRPRQILDHRAAIGIGDHALLAEGLVEGGHDSVLSAGVVTSKVGADMSMVKPRRWNDSGTLASDPRV